MSDRAHTGCPRLERIAHAHPLGNLSQHADERHGRCSESEGQKREPVGRCHSEHQAPNKLFYSFWITPRCGETLRVSTRHRPSDVWALAGALTSHIGLHVLRFSDIVNGERSRADRSLSMFGDMIPWFHEALKWRFLLYSYGTFLDGFFCYLTCSMLDYRSYGRIVTSGEWTSGT